MSELGPAAIIVTGACNVHERHRSLLGLALFAGLAIAECCYSNITRGVYADLGKLANSQLVVPPKLGLLTPDATYEATVPVITHKIEKYADDKVTLIGHSMGGIVVARLAHDRPDLVRNAVAIGSPFLGITGSLFRQDALISNTELIRQQRKDLIGKAPPLHFVASTGDMIVPVHSAIPKMIDATSTLISEYAPGHVSMVKHPAVLDVCRSIIN